MSDCCTPKEQFSITSDQDSCPICMVAGKKVKLITLKSMLKPTSLVHINSELNHYFCNTNNCDVAYFDSIKRTYDLSEVKVPIHQKDNSLIVPVCYCFDWTKEKIKEYVERGLNSDPVENIRNHIKENRCGCEVNNPQGSCCLGNVTKYIKSLSLEVL